MRRLAGLGVVLALAALVQHSGLGSAEAGGSAALGVGFALIAAALVGAFAEQVSLPRVSGYLLLGLICGPYGANLLTEAMARELRLFNGIAVALIAFIAGLEINFMRLRPRMRNIAALGGSTLGVMYAVLFPAIWAAWPWLPLTPDVTGAERVAFSMVLTVILISFSPTVTIAVIAENRARGPLSELAVAVVILTDLVLILAFALAMQAAAWASGMGTSRDVGLAVHVVWELLGSFAFGAAVGSVFALYLKFVARELTSMLLVLCGILTLASNQMEFEPLLAALAAGLVVENIAPPSGDALKQAVERGALPVLIIFFAAAGASLNLSALAELGGLAVLISALRAGSMWAGTSVGRAVSGDESPEARSLWMALISQAGVTLGLTIIVASQYPSWGLQLQTLVVSLIAIHEVIGPVLFRAALARAGEIGKMDVEAPKAGAEARALH
jgi:Kef-type K+ transport system membrane component KefB